MKNESEIICEEAKMANFNVLYYPIIHLPINSSKKRYRCNPVDIIRLLLSSI
jgi:hypothetical protein